MYEANVTVVGNVVTEPVLRNLSNGEQVVSFRMASNSRRFDRAVGEWVDNGTLFLTVTCWRRLVEGVAASLHRGDPIIAHGQLRSHEYRTNQGAERREVEMRAGSVGPDLSRCSATVSRRPSATTGMGRRNAGAASEQVAAEHAVSEQAVSEQAVSKPAASDASASSVHAQAKAVASRSTPSPQASKADERSADSAGASTDAVVAAVSR